jgi:hypothetical protein
MQIFLIESLMVVLVLVYICSLSLFIGYRNKGHGFIASFDMAAIWGGALFGVGLCLDMLSYTAQA